MPPLTLSPHHGDVREFYGEVVAAAGSMPVLAYHFPQVSAPGITLEELKALKVAGIKDSSGDCERLLEELAHFHRPVYTGSSSIVAWAGHAGRAPAPSSPPPTSSPSCASTPSPAACAAQKDLLAAHKIVSCYGVKGIKEELARRHGTSTVCR